MSVSYEVTGTIRAQMGGHPPLVLVCYAIDHVVTGGVIVRHKESAGMRKYAPH